MFNHSIWVIETLRYGEWVRYGNLMYNNATDAIKDHAIIKETIFEIRGITKLRIAEYRNYCFTKPNKIISHEELL